MVQARMPASDCGRGEGEALGSSLSAAAEGDAVLDEIAMAVNQVDVQFHQGEAADWHDLMKTMVPWKGSGVCTDAD